MDANKKDVLPVDMESAEKIEDKRGDNYASKSWYITLNNPDKWGYWGNA